MVTIFSRIIHYGFTNFWRNGLLSTATVAIMTLCLLVFLGLILANVVTTNLVNFIKDRIDISVYFKTIAPEDQILNIQSSLEKLPEVKSVEYISADQALENFKNAHQNDPTVLQSLNELQANPFQPTLNIKSNDPNKFSSIAGYLDTPDLNQYIDNVSYSKNQVVIDRLVGIIADVNRIGLTITIILSLIAGLVVYNTIRLVIYSNRDEISIMRAVGASNALVRGPYIVEGFITGAIASILSLFIFIILFVAFPAVYSSSGFSLSIPGFDTGQYLLSNSFKLLGYQLLFGIGLAALSSFFAVRKYLRN